MSTLATTWHHMRRQPYQSLAMNMVIAITMFALSIFLLFSIGFNRVINYYESKPEITIFLKDGLDKSTLDSVQKELSSFEGVKEIRFISKEKALENYRELNKDKPVLLEMVTASILPASFEVTGTSQETLSQIAQSFTIKKDVVDEVVYPEDIIRPLLQITDSLKKIALGIIIFLTLTTLLLVTGTMTQKITASRDEIKISRLLGASKWFVVSPFVIEGLFQSISGGLLGWASAFFCLFYFKDSLNNFFSPIIFFDYTSLASWQTLAFTIFFAMLLGIVSTFVGARRQIKF